MKSLLMGGPTGWSQRASAIPMSELRRVRGEVAYPRNDLAAPTVQPYVPESAADLRLEDD